MLVAVVNSGIVFTVPPVVVTSCDVSGVTEAAALLVAIALAALALGGAASTNAEGGSPPIVWASTAFMA